MISTIAPAPAAWALCHLATKVQVPRWISTIAPAGMPAKSAASQPESDEFGAGEGSVRSAAHTGAVRSPEGELTIEPKSPPGIEPAMPGTNCSPPRTARIGGVQSARMSSS